VQKRGGSSFFIYDLKGRVIKKYANNNFLNSIKNLKRKMGTTQERRGEGQQKLC